MTAVLDSLRMAPGNDRMINSPHFRLNLPRCGGLVFRSVWCCRRRGQPRGLLRNRFIYLYLPYWWCGVAMGGLGLYPRITALKPLGDALPLTLAPRFLRLDPIIFFATGSKHIAQQKTLPPLLLLWFATGRPEEQKRQVSPGRSRPVPAARQQSHNRMNLTPRVRLRQSFRSSSACLQALTDSTNVRAKVASSQRTLPKHRSIGDTTACMRKWLTIRNVMIKNTQTWRHDSPGALFPSM